MDGNGNKSFIYSPIFVQPFSILTESSELPGVISSDFYDSLFRWTRFKRAGTMPNDLSHLKFYLSSQCALSPACACRLPTRRFAVCSVGLDAPRQKSTNFVRCVRFGEGFVLFFTLPHSSGGR